MNVVIKIKDTELYYSLTSSLESSNWNASRELAKVFSIPNLTQPKLEMLNRFLTELFGEAWIYDKNVSKSEYIRKLKERLTDDLVYIVVSCYKLKDKIEFEQA